MVYLFTDTGSHITMIIIRIHITHRPGEGTADMMTIHLQELPGKHSSPFSRAW